MSTTMKDYFCLHILHNEELCNQQVRCPLSVIISLTLIHFNV